ncbi:hypothetical protein EYF80_031806 [Liparis tanakae]|uniref:Uncharacterized protein n=1 Tax=Liparis tanakae TaxID=230148 RepID=A0A4Z2GZA0_9TELE|nr:hypothetical protein EYF80_031806 [Liparis tanakae]
MADGGRMGLKAESSVLEGGCSFTFITWEHPHTTITIVFSEPTLGTAAWKRMLVTGLGAEDSMEMMTTSTSGRDGGQSRAKVNNTRRLCLSNTVTGNRLPEDNNNNRKCEAGK